MNREQLHPLEIYCMNTEAETKKQICIGKANKNAVFEQILSITGTQKYAVYQQMADDTWQLDKRLEYEGFIPLAKTPLTHPSEPIEYESEEALYNNVKAYIHKHLDLPNELGYDILTAFVFSTWMNELFDFTPYIGFYGREAVGKSRALEVLKELCFRAWLTTNLTTATLFRLTEKFQPTLLLDESEFLTSEDKKELIGLLNSGQRRGVFIPRMKGEHSEEIEFFNVYSPKAIAGTEQLKRTTTSRMIVFTMTKNVRSIPRRIDTIEGLRLRSQLLMWRFRTIAKSKATAEYPELEPLSGRLFELIYPLYYSARTQEARNNILEFARELESSKLEAEKTGLSSMIFEAIINLKDVKVNKGLLLLKHIAQYVNTNQPPQYWITEKTIAIKCNQMGFAKTRTSAGTAIIINQQLIERLKRDPRYSTTLMNFNEGNEANEPKTPSQWLR